MIPILQNRLGEPPEGIKAPAAWTPAKIPGGKLYLPGTSLMFQDDAKTTPANMAGDEIFHATDLISGKDCDAEALGTRPFLRSDATRNGSLHFLNSTAQRYFEVQNTQSYFNNFHEDGTATVLFFVKFDNASTGSQEMVMGNHASGSTTRSFSINRSATSNNMNLFINLGGTTRFLNNVNTVINDTDWHAVKLLMEPGTDKIRYQVDNGTVVTGTLPTLTTGNADANLFIGKRADSAFPGAFQISSLFIGNQVVSDADIARWEAYDPPLM